VRAPRRFSSFWLRIELAEELRDRPTFPGTVFSSAFSYRPLDLWVPELEVIFKLIGAHNARDRDAIFLQDEVLLTAELRTTRRTT
jgi:hypothetical protein